MTGIDDIEVKTVLALTKYFSKHWVIFDVGSNKGEWSDILINERDHSDQDGKYTIHFFEPNELLLNYCRVKYDYNLHVIYNPLAVTDKDNQEIDFYYFTNFNNGLSSIYWNDFWKEQGLPVQKGKAKTVRLDTYSETIPEIDFIKVDVEGAEIDVLRGCEDLLKEKAVKFIQVEYGMHYPKRNGLFKRDVIEYVNKFGYHVYRLEGEYFTKVDDTFVEDFHAENYILTHLVIERYHYTQLWNSEFIKTTQGLGPFRFALEIGCFEGLTSNYICDHLLGKSDDSRHRGRMICIDPLTDEYLPNYDKATNSLFIGQYERFVKNTIGQPIQLIRKKSVDAYEDLKDFRFDFIYVDGDHTEAGVYLDGMRCWEILLEGGYLLFDDYKGYLDLTTFGINKFLAKHVNQYQVISSGYQLLIRKLP